MRPYAVQARIRKIPTPHLSRAPSWLTHSSFVSRREAEETLPLLTIYAQYEFRVARWDAELLDYVAVVRPSLENT